MKLLTRSSIYFSVFFIIILLLSGTGLFYLLRTLVYEEVDEYLVLEKQFIQDRYEEQGLEFLDRIRDSQNIMISDVFSVLPCTTDVLQDTFLVLPHEDELAPFRQLSFAVGTDSTYYFITIRKSLFETEDLVESISIAIGFTILCSFILLVLLNVYGQSILWKPFRELLTTMKFYDFRSEVVFPEVPTKIDEFRDLNTHLTNLTGKLKQEYQLVKRFTEDASHEMQTPVAAIITNLEMSFQETVPEERRRNYIAEAYRSANTLSRLHSALATLTRLENGEFEDNIHIDIPDKVRQILKSMQDLIDAKKIAIETVENASISIWINESIIDLMLRNLLQNAIKHNVPNGSIWISFEKNLLKIENTGKPYTGDPERLFGRFRKAIDSSPSLGLGLSIVQQICHLENFTITYSVEEALHTIILTFPSMK